ncbi:hypothetical protein [Marinicella litoralis]|uniref:Uncharacterized protein n=1 Tax=Marinicella litoralis TaxID=644220 RepID=A0A4R6XZL6_9GAMM|nr:hypothetical protein [Marinicella litoralis]TDR23233.1 hypothetical protein C8D91_0093 [Marinicella litoralis]
MNKLFNILILILLPTVSFAYIDPGSGSAIMSAIIGFFVAIGLAVKTYWYKLKSFFVKSKKHDKQDQNDAED